MAVRIRLSRCGRKNRPHYRIAVYDAQTRRDGRYLELLGHYDPLTHDPKAKLKLETDRLTAWVGKGALATPAVAQLFRRLGHHQQHAMHYIQRIFELALVFVDVLQVAQHARHDLARRRRLEVLIE